jgi:hypothetical protein
VSRNGSRLAHFSGSMTPSTAGHFKIFGLWLERLLLIWTFDQRARGPKKSPARPRRSGGQRLLATVSSASFVMLAAHNAVTIPSLIGKPESMLRNVAVPIASVGATRIT